MTTRIRQPVIASPPTGGGITIDADLTQADNGVSSGAVARRIAELAATQAANTLSSGALARRNAEAELTQGAHTVSASATSRRLAELAATQDAQATSADATARRIAGLTATQEGDQLSADASKGGGRSASLNAQQDPQSIASDSVARRVADAAISQDGHSLAGAATARRVAALTANQDQQSASSTATARRLAMLSATMAGDSLSGSAGVNAGTRSADLDIVQANATLSSWVNLPFIDDAPLQFENAFERAAMRLARNRKLGQTAVYVPAPSRGEMPYLVRTIVSRQPEPSIGLGAPGVMLAPHVVMIGRRALTYEPQRGDLMETADGRFVVERVVRDPEQASWSLVLGEAP